MSNRREYVEEGRLCIQHGECRAWFRLADIDRAIARLESELRDWQRRREMLQGESRG